MKRYIFLLVLFLSFTQILKAQKTDPHLFMDAYHKAYMEPGKDSLYYQRMFFNILPANFKTFSKYYGWNEQAHHGQPLSNVPPKYFTRVFYSKAYSEQEMLKKMIGIAVNGVGGVDAIARFQDEGYQLALNRNVAFIRTLQTFSKPEIVSVWKYYFDYRNNSYRKAAYEKMRNVTEHNNKAMAALVTEGYQQAVAKWAKIH